MSSPQKNQQLVENMNNHSNNLLNKLESYLKEFVSPIASEIDQDPVVLKQALQGLIDHSLLALKVPHAWGGLEVESETFYLSQQLLSRYSGALAFLQLQHHGAISAIVSSTNDDLKQQYLPQVVQEKILIGQGFSQLRRRGKPMMKAIATKEGYYLTGNVPWITGFGFFDMFIIGAVLPDGQELRAIIPFIEDGQGIKFSEPMKLCAMQSTNTVTATLENYFLPIENVVSIKEKEAIYKNDKKVVLYPSFLVLGCAEAGLDIVEKVRQIKQLDFIQEGFTKLNDEYNRCHEKIKQAMTIHSRSFDADLQLRVWAINLAQRCAQAAIIVSSGASNYHDHPAQRVYREALVFSVFAQTTDIMRATLAKIL